ncbi:hypothetical protein NDU88_004503 [Pleurodeles waltl]|uniref:Uncharacterized protein n=1 Tax=Pleurodeles waltl TaxID=8319 RepID=A0AAV7T9J6_PLEWA|nr:hypothetical protein NDU88_004503 [Pleurodeles waltl]
MGARLKSAHLNAQGIDHPPAEMLNPAGAQILTAIEQSKQALENKMDTVSTEVNLLAINLYKVNEGSLAMEERVALLQLAVKVKDLHGSVKADKCKQMDDKLDDTEGKSQHCNLCSVGFPEQLEGTDPTEFLEQRIKNTIGPG